MAQLTVSQKITIGLLSEAYSTIDILKSGLYGGGIDLQLPRKIYCLTKNIQWLYNLSPNDSTLTDTTNYLIAICGKYYLQSQGAISGGQIINPNQPTQFTYLIPITGADFSDATNYNNPKIVGKILQIFWNDINRYILSSEYNQTSTGIDILIPGFDATANPTYELLIYIVNP